MNKSVFIEELRDIFCDNNKHDKRYSRVWLNEADFGGLYNSGKYILSVKADHHLDQRNPEIKYIINFLSEKLGKEKMSFIRTVTVYNAEEEVHYENYDIVVFNEEVAC